MANFKVISQQQSIELTADGRFIDVMEVTFEIPSGASGTVRIPLRDYHPEQVASIVDDQAAKMEAVEGLSTF